MALKKSDLYPSLWQGCDELRGGMDASQYEDYVLVLLFVKCVSDRYAGQPYGAITIPAGASFTDMVALKGKPDIGDQINKMRDVPPSVEWRHHRLPLSVRPGTLVTRRAEVLEAWYRQQLREAVPALLARWEARVGVRVNKVFVQRMKTR